MYVLTHEMNVTRLPDWAARWLDRLADLIGDRCNSPQGWRLTCMKTGVELGSTREIFADEASCYAACDWASELVVELGLAPVTEWFDHDEHPCGRIEFQGETDPRYGLQTA
jgi:hypothetical protein